MIHVVFQENDQEVLQKAIELDPLMEGTILQVRDDWAVGPIADIYKQEGIENRRLWWREVLIGGDYEGLMDDPAGPNDAETVSSLRASLQDNPSEIVWIWAAQNKHDVSGYYWLISQLKEFQGRIFILYLNNLPFINLKGHIFYPENLFEIPPREFLKAKKLARPVTASEFEVDGDEWSRLCSENKWVRILEGGKKLQSQEADYYDKTLGSFITGEWQRAGRVIQHFLARAPQKTGDAFLLWRLKKLAAAGEADVQGEVKKMKDFEIKRNTAVMVAG